MSMDIGAIQQGSGIDIGARESADGAPPATTGQIIIISANTVGTCMPLLIPIVMTVIGRRLGARRNVQRRTGEP